MRNVDRATADELERIFPGESEMAGRMRAFDWAKTPLGSPVTWPQNLCLAVGICLTSRFPLFLWWGSTLTMLYNDAYISFLGRGKHPQMLGRSGREAWAEIWDTVGPLYDAVMTTGSASWSEDLLMFFDRILPEEEVYATFSYSPILGEDRQVDGIFCACTETPDKVVGNRRLETLRRLGIRATEVRTVEAACQEAASVLGGNPRDIPFAAIYVVDAPGQEARLCATVLPAGEHHLPTAVSPLEDDTAFPWPLAAALRTRRAVEIADLAA